MTKWMSEEFGIPSWSPSGMVTLGQVQGMAPYNDFKSSSLKIGIAAGWAYKGDVVSGALTTGWGVRADNEVRSWSSWTLFLPEELRKFTPWVFDGPHREVHLVHLLVPPASRSSPALSGSQRLPAVLSSIPCWACVAGALSLSRWFISTTPPAGLLFHLSAFNNYLSFIRYLSSKLSASEVCLL